MNLYDISDSCKKRPILLNARDTTLGRRTIGLTTNMTGAPVRRYDVVRY